MPDSFRVYLAAPLFNPNERAFNLSLCTQLEEFCDVFLPQRDGLLFKDLLTAGVPVPSAQRMIFDVDISAIRQCDILIAVLDGRSIDEGVAFEIGFAYALSKRCYAIKTDERYLLPAGDNPIIVSACEKTFGNLEDLLVCVRRTCNLSLYDEISKA